MALTPEEATKLVIDVLNGDQGFNRIVGADVDPVDPLMFHVQTLDRHVIVFKMTNHRELP